MTAGGAVLVAAASGAAWSLLVAEPAEAGPIYSGREDGVAIKGADPVAYFTEGRAVEGRAEHSLIWRGAEWRFASAANRALFEGDPERYAPRYGGFCAYAAANGQKAKIEPEAWSIVDGKLYLNYDRPIRERWNAKQSEYIAAADRNWPAIAAR